MNLLRLITPTNLAVEEEKFFGSSVYQPRFEYDWDVSEINSWITKKPKYAALARAVMDQDNQAITYQAEMIFDTPWNEDVYKQAEAVMQPPNPNVYRPTLDELVKAQEQWIHSFKIDYSVKVVDAHGFVARPNHKEKSLEISRYVEYYFFSLESSIRHDAVHLIRFLNGQYNHIPRSPNYLPTEEGMATFMQDFGGNEPNNSHFQHAAEYTATNVCRQGSLRDAVDYLRSIGFPSKLAWQRAVRHKFGFRDTSKPGDIMKPAMYFSHSLATSKLNPDERLRLLMGKISLDDLPHYNQYQGRWDRTKLMTLFHKSLI